MNRLNIAYFGSPQFSSDFLEKLLTNKDLLRLIKVSLVVTQPDKPVGRKQNLTPTPVKQIAMKYKSEALNTKSETNFNVLNFKNLNIISNFEFRISELNKIDLALVYAYAKIIPKKLLDIPRYGFWCIHPSLLPKYRGTSPMATALMNGDKTTGVTIINMDEKIDHGPIIIQDKYQILSTDKRPDLEKKLTDLAFNLFKKQVVYLASSRVNELKFKYQNDKIATYTKKLAKQDGFIEFENLKKFFRFSTSSNRNVVTLRANKVSREVTAPRSNEVEKIYNLFRGLYPWPGLWTILPNRKRLKMTEMKIENGKLKIVRVQLEGKKEVDFEIFNKAYKVF